jgi:2,4-dienoyl-CoA reductase-like NADH-dependent reductase (Old Yellow Enzyme family)
MSSDPLAQPLRLPCGHQLPNRIGKSAMSEALGTVDNRVTAKLGTLYERWSQGGLGLCITGNVMVDRRALGEPHNVALEDDRDLDAFRTWAKQGTSAGTSLFMQLNHPGKQTPRHVNPTPMAPSAVPPVNLFRRASAFGQPRAMTEADIQQTIEAFARAAGAGQAARASAACRCTARTATW